MMSEPIGEHEEVDISNEELDDHGMIKVSKHDQIEKMKNFKKISEDCKRFEEEFRDCLDNIPDGAWEEKEIQKCVGRDFTRIMNHMSYEKSKIIDRIQQSFRDIMIKDCYEPAGEDEILSDACDLFEKDVNKLMWNELNFFELIVFNKDKYTFVYERMPDKTFHIITKQLQVIYKDTVDLLEETNAHRDVMVVRIKEHVDDRTHHIVEEARAFAQKPDPVLHTYDIQIKQTISDPTEVFTGLNLPANLRLDKETKNAFGGKNHYQNLANEIERHGRHKLKNMYKGMRNEEVYFDPDRNQDESYMHNDHQKAALDGIFNNSLVLSKEEGHDSNAFMEHHSSSDSNYRISTDFKKRKLRQHEQLYHPVRRIHKGYNRYVEEPHKHQGKYYSKQYRNMI